MREMVRRNELPIQMIKVPPLMFRPILLQTIQTATKNHLR
jgi:hypothetical protein